MTRAAAPAALGLPLLSGVLLAASAPPAPSPLLPFVALVPLALWTAGLDARSRGAPLAFGGGLLAGAVQHAWGLRWLPGTLTAVAGAPTGWLAFAGVVAVLGGLTGAAVAGLHRLARHPAPAPFAVALALVWTALEWTLAHLPFGWAFPWAPLGLGLARWPDAIGIAELAGVTGLTLWLAVVNGLLADAVMVARSSRGRGASLAVAAAAALVVLLPLGWGVLRARSMDAPVVGRVAAVALDVAPRSPPGERAALGIASAERALADLTPGSVQLVVLPEMLLPLDPRSSAGASASARLAALATRLHAPLLVGALGVEGGREFNSAVLVRGPADGSPPFRADKRRLVPGAERGTRVRAPWLARSEAGYAPGSGWPVARTGSLALGVLVCFDAAFAADARGLVRNGARALAALTSDAWFGGGRAGRAGIAQQTAHLTLRVVETRTGAVRASNGGPALILDPTGAPAAAAESGLVAGAMRSAVRPTLFVRTGDLAGPSALLGLLALLGLRPPGAAGPARRRHAFS